MSRTSDVHHQTLLKLHGCVDHADSIVLSREDYMRYADVYAALRGHLQGLFLTTQVLFCGFSMTDDNVHRTIDQCRKVLYRDGKATGKMGSILTMVDNAMFRRLWDDDFHIVSFGSAWPDNPAWFHDCFVDCLAAAIAERHASDAILLNPRFKHLLTDAEAQLKETIESLIALHSDSAMGDSSKAKIASVLETFGFSV